MFNKKINSNKLFKDARRSRKYLLQCSLCKAKGLSAEKDVYICDSGHVICEICQNLDKIVMATKHNNRDFVSDEKCLITNKKIFNKCKKIQSQPGFIRVTDFANGDYNECFKSLKIKRKFESESIIKTEYDANKHGDCNNYPRISPKEENQRKFETTIEYENINYRENETSTASSMMKPLCDEIKINNNIDTSLASYCPVSRPLTCPVYECGKIITTDFVTSHFYFDHSKIPRILLKTLKPRQICLNSSDIIMESRCLGILLLEITNKSNSHEQLADTDLFVPASNQKYAQFLLMGVRMHNKFEKNINEHNTLTLNDVDIHFNVNKNEIIAHKEDKQEIYSVKNKFDPNEILILWICKLDNIKRIYTITISKDNNMLSYSYTGEAVSVKDKQNARSMYQRPDCLIIQGVAANRLVDDLNRIRILINII